MGLPPYLAQAGHVIVVWCTLGLAGTGFAGCGTAARKPTPSDGQRFEPAPGLRQRGYASYYANSLAGQHTASGDRYRPQKYTAAHRTLPFGTWVKVTRLDGEQLVGPSVLVRINDRGPFHSNRVLDVSLAVAEQLGMLGPGVVRVELEVVSASSRPP